MRDDANNFKITHITYIENINTAHFGRIFFKYLAHYGIINESPHLFWALWTYMGIVESLVVTVAILFSLR